MKNLTWQNPEQLFVAQELINKVKSKCCGIKVLLIGSNIIALIGIILLLQFKKVGFYVFILTYFLTALLGFVYPDYVDSSIIFKSFFGLGLFLLLLCFKNKETKMNGYQTLGIVKSKQNNDVNISPINQDVISDDVCKGIDEESNVSVSNPEVQMSIVSNFDNEVLNEKEEIIFDTEKIDEESPHTEIIDNKKEHNNIRSFWERIKKSNKGMRIGLYLFLGVLVLFLAISLFVCFKSYPPYISSFCDKCRYTFNLSNNSLCETLLERVFQLRKNTWYLLDIPGYNQSVGDSARFFKSREDIYREYPNASTYMAESIVNDFSTIESNVYYIIDPGSGEPYAYKGSKLSSDNDAIADAFSKKVYRTTKYDYDKQKNREIQLLDEAAKIRVSDIGLIRKIGQIYEKHGIFSKAADYYRFELEHNGDKAEIRGMLAYALALNGESSDSREQAKIALEKDSKERYALSALAIVESDEYNWKEAKMYAKKAIDYGAEDSYVYYAYCEALYKQGEIKAAHMNYNKAYETYRFNPRRDKYAQYAGCPFEVIDFHYSSEKNDGKTIIPYDGSLVSGLCFYICVKIDVNVLRSDDAKIGIKIYSNGKLESGQTSQDGYTYFEELPSKKLGETSLYISAWGSNSPGTWSAGNHQIELWYKGEKIAEDSFYIY